MSEAQIEAGAASRIQQMSQEARIDSSQMNNSSPWSLGAGSSNDGGRGADRHDGGTRFLRSSAAKGLASHRDVPQPTRNSGIGSARQVLAGIPGIDIDSLPPLVGHEDSNISSALKQAPELSGKKGDSDASRFLCGLKQDAKGNLLDNSDQLSKIDLNTTFGSLGVGEGVEHEACPSEDSEDVNDLIALTGRPGWVPSHKRWRGAEKLPRVERRGFKDLWEEHKVQWALVGLGSKGHVAFSGPG